MVLRFYTPNWDNFGCFHPDETNTDAAVVRVHFFYPPGQPRQIDPDFFAYGGLSIYLYRLTCEAVASVTQNVQWIQEAGHINVVGRIWSALFSTLTIIPLWYLVLRVFGSDGRGRRIALCTLLLYAFCATSIQMAHYDTTESMLALFITLIALVSLRLVERPTFGNYLLLGLLGGLSLATKMSALSFAVFPLAAHVLALARAQTRIVRQRRTETLRAQEAEVAQSKSQRRRTARATRHNADEDATPATLVVRERPSWGQRAVAVWVYPHLYLGLCVLLAFALFFLGSPYTFINKAGQIVALTSHPAGTPLAERFLNPDLVGSMRYEGGVVDGSVPVNYTLQFDGTHAYTFWLRNLFWQLGLVAAPCLIAVPLLIRWAFLKRNYRPLLLLSFPLAYFAYIGRWHTKFNRYMIPLVPFLLITGAWLLIALWDWNREPTPRPLDIGEAPTHPTPWGRWLVGALVGVTMWWGLAFSSIYWREPSRYAASRWMYEHIPVGSEIIREHWDYGLPAPLQMDTSRTSKDASGGEEPIIETRDSRDYPSVVNERGETTGLRIYDDEIPPSDVPLDAATRERIIKGKAAYYAHELAKSQYMVVASRRMYGTLPRLTDRFPLTGRYYRLLFADKLGYTRAATFSAYPSLLGITIPDDNAEETFQVFDHPKVIVFQNTGRLTERALYHLLISDTPATDSLPFPR